MRRIAPAGSVVSQNRVNVQIDPGAIFTRRSISRVPPVSTPPARNARGAAVNAQNTACPPRRALAFVGGDARAPPWTSLPLSRQRPAVSDHHGRLRYDETDRLRASAAVHDHRETPSAIPLKPASTIAEIRTKSTARPETEASGTWEIHRRLGLAVGGSSMSTERTILREADATVEVGLAHKVLGARESRVQGEGAGQSETESGKH
jgi:hypothetical protein